MNKVYKNQTELKLRVDLSVDLTTADTILIKYIKPDNITGSFIASVEDPDKGIIYYNVQGPTDFDVVGKWTLWAHVTFVGGNYAAGEPYTLEIFEEGTFC